MRFITLCMYSLINFNLGICGAQILKELYKIILFFVNENNCWMSYVIFGYMHLCDMCLFHGIFC